ncbi:MAG: helix-turn-helix transcriptional regulator [Bacteroidota bacterium]
MNSLLFFDYNQKSSILLIFCFNAFVFSALLFMKGSSSQHQHSKWLAAFIALGGLYVSLFMLGYGGWYSKRVYREFMFFMPLQQLFLIGPVFFFYVKSLLRSKHAFTRKDIIHFLPAILYLIYSLIVFITDKLILDEFYFYADGKDKDLDYWYQIAGLLSMLFYLSMSLRYYFNYRKIAVQEVSFADEIAFTWIKHFAIAFGLILLLRVLFFILNPEWWNFGSKFWYYLCFSILLLYISITGYTNTIKATTYSSSSGLLLVDFQSPKNAQHTVADEEPEEMSMLHEWKKKINQLFEEEGIHEKPNLTLTDLAHHLDTNRNAISKVINTEFDMNFNDFVNEKRAKAVIERLNQGEHHQHTLLSIALDCGFNSKTTFNRAFKKHTGITPKQYITKNQL